ncbi:MAG: porin [Bacteroidaceae bacterium]|nr:porin [Bacteroidaceae bacterium]
MKKIKFIIASIMVCVSTGSQAQDIKEEPKGKAIVQVFGNFHTGFGAENDDRGFELERSYLGYEYNLGKGLSVKGVMDIGKSSDVSDYQRIAYIKNAMVSWKNENLTLNGGLISTTQFNFQEKFWGYRYIMKSFQDQYKFGNSADLGISAAYKFADWISADAIIVNGEGYKKIQKNDGLNYGLGVTLTPAKGFQVRLYGGLNESPEKNSKDIVNMAAFMGYKSDKFSIGAEYNHLLNASYKEDADQYGYSVFATLNLSKETSLYARFDELKSKDDWNKAKDEQAAILGAQFKLGKYVKVAPNVRMSMPKANGADDKYSAYINCYFGF